MDLTPISTVLVQFFNALGNVLIVVGAAGAVLVWVGGIGLPMLTIPFNRRASEFVKVNIGWFFAGCAVLGSSGVASRVLAAAILAGKIG